MIPDHFADPLQLFEHYFARAKATETQDPTAMSLATATASGRPAVRMVLLKGVDARGLVFFTNYTSRKAAQLTENPYAALCLHWPVLQVQVRSEGPIERVTAAESDAYFQSRPLGSQLAAWASSQSAPLPSRELLLSRYHELEQRFAGKPVPRPEFWGGFRLLPERLEFWSNEPYRMHDRLLYERELEGDRAELATARWRTTRLYP
ncbi:MAG TPA: pyridoxamine 5'-phosphate oxidase [Pseudomonadota bacterium]|nr:pyridoxamine 5'-phosphate oxidase [Pseudomonadota bacterium]